MIQIYETWAGGFDMALKKFEIQNLYEIYLHNFYLKMMMVCYIF